MVSDYPFLLINKELMNLKLSEISVERTWVKDFLCRMGHTFNTAKLLSKSLTDSARRAAQHNRKRKVACVQRQFSMQPT